MLNALKFQNRWDSSLSGPRLRASLGCVSEILKYVRYSIYKSDGAEVISIACASHLFISQIRTLISCNFLYLASVWFKQWANNDFNQWTSASSCIQNWESGCNDGFLSKNLRNESKIASNYSGASNESRDIRRYTLMTHLFTEVNKLSLQSMYVEIRSSAIIEENM